VILVQSTAYANRKAIYCIFLPGFTLARPLLGLSKKNMQPPGEESVGRLQRLPLLWVFVEISANSELDYINSMPKRVASGSVISWSII
jgi:hypothetical protein